MAKNVSLDTFMNKEKCLLQNNTAYSIRAVDGDRATTCSVSSGNSADDRASYEEKHAKNNEELECQSDVSHHAHYLILGYPFLIFFVWTGTPKCIRRCEEIESRSWIKEKASSRST